MNSDIGFLEMLKQSFITFLKTSARSNEKLKILHSYITKDLYNKLIDENFTFYSLGFEKGKETCINGRYMDKKVDIVIKNSETNEYMCGIGVKFVMNNYSQNSNNYFENMLGETSNIRCNNIPYFQVLCIFDTLPYYDKYGKITKWEHITKHNIDKYSKLSEDNIDFFYHTPNKTLLFIISIDCDITSIVKTKKEYKKYFLENINNFSLMKSNLDFKFNNTVIYNNYDKFIEKVIYTIKSR